MMLFKRYYLIGCLLVLVHVFAYGQVQLPRSGVLNDTLPTAPAGTPQLGGVTVTGSSGRNAFEGATPSQSLDKRTLSQLNAPSVGDAAKYFSGVLVRDYGGAGGLKTVSVRSLGAAHTGILYDGIPVSDVQTGQVDLGRYSSAFLNSLDLYQANATSLPSTARSYASASLLAMQTKAFSPSTIRNEWLAGMRQGSFDYWQPFAGVSTKLKNHLDLTLNAEALSSKGRYPFFISNGTLSGRSHRLNSDVRSFQSELNLLKQFRDSSTLQLKGFTYLSDRGLPGSIVLYNPESNQRLRTSDHFIQARYKKVFQQNTVLLLSAKYNNSYTKYTDPDFQNNSGGLDNRYKQKEYYLSAAVSKIIKMFTASMASDVAYTTLRSNTNNFASPARTSLWNNASLHYARGILEVNGSALLTTIIDSYKGSAARINKLTPTISASLRPAGSAFLFRAFYKHVFRMPTFNDLYYILVGNSSLTPEYARQYNAGVVFTKTPSGKIRTVKASADLYYNSIRDKIIAVPGQNLFVWTMLNLGKVSITGADLTAELSGKLATRVEWFMRLAYTYQQATDITDRTASGYRDRIPYTPDHSGSGLTSITWNTWTFGYSLLFSGTRYSLGDNNPYNQLSGWGTHDVFAAKHINCSSIQLDLKAELNNISNEQYDIIRSYPMPGRSYKVSVTISNK